MTNIKLRYFAKKYPNTSSWGGQTLDTSYTTKPVLQFWDGEKWVDVPVVVEVQNAYTSPN